jgi:hypothetical protein
VSPPPAPNHGLEFELDKNRKQAIASTT